MKVLTTLAERWGFDSTRANKLADVMLFLTLFSMVPYDKELMFLIPPSWQPYIIKFGMASQLLLRFLKSSLQKQEQKEETP